MGMMIHRRKEGHLHYPKPEQIVKEDTVQKEVKDENKGGAAYTRNEINKLPFFSLKALASEYGVDVKGKKAPELRTELIEKMGI